MKRSLAIGLLAAAALPPAARTQTDPQSFDQVQRGRYLAIAADCTACHTKPGQPIFAGGRGIATPFGTLISPNLTPDPETGIGRMSDDDFVNSLKDGVGAGGHLYPAMPYTYYTRMSRSDALAIRAYLNTVPPVRNKVKSDQLPFPLDIRASMAAWDALYFKKGDFQQRPDKSAAWNRGGYLVEALEHCGMCHTPKNLLGADETDHAYQGYVVQGWFAPNLTSNAHLGLGGWSEQDIVEYLRTGHNRISAASGPMAEAVMDSTSHLSDADLKAMAIYLKDLPAAGAAKPQPLPPESATMKTGEALYADNCEACHTREGAGIPKLFPALKGSPLVQSEKATGLIHVVLEGSRSAGTDGAPTAPAMPTFDWRLNDAQVAAVLTYIRNSWGNAAPAVTPEDVSGARKEMGSGND